MKIIKSDNGFPHAWKAGRVEQLIRSILEEKASNQLDVGCVMLINPTWLLDRDLSKEIKDARPDFIICHNFVDPVVLAVKQIIESSGIPHLFIGNNNQFRLDFWAMACDLFFKSYTDTELQLQLGAKKFMCLNRKPHAHRVVMMQYLEQVRDHGHLKSDADYDLVDADIGDYTIPNDVYTLGDINTWQDSYLNIVTETVFSSDEFFISEKTWKPIIGLRPFFIYGQPKLRKYLKENGFDLFEDFIDYSGCVTEQDYAQLAVDTVNKIYPAAYPQLLTRLKNNRNKFHSYVYKQWNNLMNLNLKDYYE